MTQCAVRLCRPSDRSCDLLAVSDKVATCTVRLFLTGEGGAPPLVAPHHHPTPTTQTDCTIMLQPKSKDNTFTRGEVPRSLTHYLQISTLTYYFHVVARTRRIFNQTVEESAGCWCKKIKCTNIVHSIQKDILVFRV